MTSRDFYWIDTTPALKASRRLGLSAFGCLGTICGLTYVTGTVIPDDPEVAASLINCTAEEWRTCRAKLLEGGDIVIESGNILPTANWARPEIDS